MNIVFFMSVILKGIGAILEVLLQVLITRKLGVDGYGTFSTWINTADLLFWILFSALTKCNTYYLSKKNTSVKKFKTKYYSRYVIPVLLVLSAGLVISGNGMYCVICVITVLELLTLDQSSTLLAQNRQMVSLTGEYVFGRIVLIVGFFVLYGTGHLGSTSLVLLYAVQYLMIIVLFVLYQLRKKVPLQDISSEVSIKKWGSYQRADIIQSLIVQVPVILQYICSGAFEAGVVSVVMVVKKLINFISGPTAKVFLPEFSRLYRSGEKGKIRECYASIMRIQMLFAGPLSVVLIGYPAVILRILEDELLNYTFLFVLCSAIFIFAATLGPCSGVLQMTGNEKKDNRYREIALAVMVVVMIIFRNDSLFVLYGLCAQALLEEIMKYYCVSKWMGRSPVKVKTYASWWICPGIAIAVIYIFHLEKSFLYMILMTGIVFVIGTVSEVRKEGGVKEMIKKRRK
ncbi:lipopolysaccharide biosynthesis protein [uncultured Eubacterium sp.]|uniref:lipopolysaccharide biosynthesis protein n=1 Tax=uncultured Eubacterium sp. TaxID=165185 RepID=UPI002598B27A|nr:hypothetical protein [uncultured Eubacterium sp.]